MDDEMLVRMEVKGSELFNRLSAKAREDLYNKTLECLTSLDNRVYERCCADQCTVTRPESAAIVWHLSRFFSHHLITKAVEEHGSN